MQQLNRKNEHDLPLKHADKCIKIVQKVFDGQDLFNYHEAKAHVLIGSSLHLLQKDEEAEKEMIQAQAIITSLFGEDVPFAAKFNIYLLVCFNKRPEGQERTELLLNVSNKNLEIVQKYYGAEHLFTIRCYLQSYLAHMAKGDGQKAGDFYETMVKLKYNGTEIKANKWIFKAKMQSVLILMQVPNSVML